MSFEFESVDRFICGTIGEPGEREFYLQVRSGTALVSASLEKSQASTLSQRLEILCKQVAREDMTLVADRVERDEAPLESPVDKDFVIGAISIAWDDDSKKVCVELFSIKEVEVEELKPSLLEQMQL
jgi:uncharacterized repeat protein (TIGR03847 family)